MSNNAIRLGIGINFPTLLTVLFIGLKILEKIDWSWWWVLSPILISWGLGLSIIFIVLFVFCLVGLISIIKQ